MGMARPGRAAGMSCEPGTGPFHGAGIAVGCWGCRYPLAPHPWGFVEQGKVPLRLKFLLGLCRARGDLLQEAQLAAFLLPDGSAGLRQKQPLVLTGRRLLARVPVWVHRSPFLAGLGAVGAVLLQSFLIPGFCLEEGEGGRDGGCASP